MKTFEAYTEATNIMVDLETVDNSPTSAIIAIGAAKFDILTGNILSEFYRTVDLSSSSQYGTMSASTIKWWMQQKCAARAIFNDPEAGTLQDVLFSFYNWVREVSDTSPRVWGNGAGFDNVILRHAYNQLECEPPFEFWNDMDVRTIVCLGRDLLGIDPKKEMTLDGVAHNALDDAKFQVAYVSKIYRELNKHLS